MDAASPSATVPVTNPFQAISSLASASTSLGSNHCPPTILTRAALTPVRLLGQARMQRSRLPAVGQTQVLRINFHAAPFFLLVLPNGCTIDDHLVGLDELCHRRRSRVRPRRRAWPAQLPGLNLDRAAIAFVQRTGVNPAVFRDDNFVVAMAIRPALPSVKLSPRATLSVILTWAALTVTSPASPNPPGRSTSSADARHRSW